jgi:hypothetical protein
VDTPDESEALAIYRAAFKAANDRVGLGMMNTMLDYLNQSPMLHVPGPAGNPPHLNFEIA